MIYARDYNRRIWRHAQDVMSKFNVITTATGGDFFEYHLRRFLWSAKKVMPDADYFLILVQRETDTLESVKELKRRAAPYFKKIAIASDICKWPGRLLYHDMLKAHALDPFGLSEGIFIDVDCDVVRSLEHLADAHKDKNIMWVQNAMPNVDEMKRVLTAFGLPTEGPYCDPGVLYLRKSYGAEYMQAVLNVHKLGVVDILSDFTPGGKIWEVVVRQSNSAVMLPYNYNPANWRYETLSEAYVIHFIGYKGKHERQFCDTREFPDKLVYYTKPVELPGMPDW